DGGNDRGAVWILSLNSNGTVAGWTKISQRAGGFGGALHNLDWFGTSLAVLGDLDGDGTVELAGGGPHDDDGGGIGTTTGGVWIPSLTRDGTVASQKKIRQTAGGFGGVLDRDDNFGYSLARLGDLDGDGTVELAVGAREDDDGGSERGALWILSL